MNKSPPLYRSPSQYKEYVECPYRYYLRRIENVPEIMSVWGPQGTAVHTAAEVYERSGRTLSTEETQQVFIDSYTDQINDQCAQVPDFGQWFSSGPYRAKEDVERRFRLGREQVARYVTYYRDVAPHEQIWTTPDGAPAIELGFEITLGDVRVRGILDQAIDHGTRLNAHVRDIKTGQTPGDGFQLAVYAEALRQTHGAQADTGDYWMARRGKPTKPYAMAEWSTQRLTEMFGHMDAGVKAGDFPAKPKASKCRTCPVQRSCSFFVR